MALMSHDELITFTGSVERVTYYNAENGYSVVKIRPDKRMPGYSSREGLVTVVGIMPELGVGEDVEFNGNWVEDPRYGMQMRVQKVNPIIPTTRNGIIRYLSSGIVKGIGEKRAEAIVDHFGEDTLNILNKNPERLTEVPKIKPSLAEKLAEAWADNVAVRQTMIFLQTYGVSSRMATRIFDYYGPDTVDVVKGDPYVLADEVYGIGFRKADQIALRMGLALDSPERLRAGLTFALNRMATEGHTYSPRADLLDKATALLEYEGPPATLEDILNRQLFQGNLIGDQIVVDGATVEAIYLPKFHRAETNARDSLRELARTPSLITEECADLDWPAYLDDLADSDQRDLTQEQQGAVQAAFTHKISVLTGGPGTGKTTTLRMVISALKDSGYSFSLASPTGRAAKRLSEATGEQAYTIHRLFGFTPDMGFMIDEADPLDVHMLIIDEASMIDLMLFQNILRGMAPQTHLMLVGDVDQLPSVGAGNVLNDVIESGIAYVTRLEKIFRQGVDSHIIVNAHRINDGLLPHMDNQSEDFFFFGEDEPAAAADLLVDVVINRIPRKFGYDPLMDVQVLAPMYRGPAGINALNRALQHALNPGSGRQAEKKLGDQVFRVGDKVMQTRNNYEKDVFNGDIGFIRAIDEDASEIIIDMSGDWINYTYGEVMDEIIHAYCISIHRSQGSEYRAVVLPILRQHYMMLQRNLLYTAITRAWQTAVLVGNRRAVSMAVKNDKVSERYSGLLARLTT